MGKMGPQVRIALRYIIGYLFAQGIIPAELHNALVEIMNQPAAQLIDVGIVIGSGIAVESIYRIAKKRGWSL